MAPESELVVVPGGTVDLLPTETVERLYKLAGLLYKSRMFQNVESAEQAFAKMVVGHHLGLNPTQSLMGLQIIRGNVGMHYSLLGAFIKSREGYDYKIVEHEIDRARIEFYRDGELLGESSFTIEDAKRAGLIKDKGGWQTFPENMCVARALSKGIRFYMPETLGGLPVYTTGEIPAQEELTAGEGSGEVPDVILPPEVEALIERAESLDAPGWADRGTWQYRVKLGKGDLTSGPLAASIQEATRDLDKLESHITDAQLVDPEVDVPIDTQGLPDLSDGESPFTDDAPGSVGKEAEAPVAQEPSEELQKLYAKRRLIEEMPADDEEEEAMKDEALAGVDVEIERQLERESGPVAEEPGQGSLL